MRTILILAANPMGTSRLRLDEEVKRIKQSLRRANRRDQFKVIDEWAVTDDDLRQALLDNEPEVVHFAGHGVRDGQLATGRELIPAGGVDADGLAFEENAGHVQLISGDALATLFELCSESVKCVVLNACYSEAQANVIARHIDFVIGMKKAIGDPAAIKFAVGFYDALFAGKDFENSFKFGRNAIDLKGIPEHLTPIIKTRVPSDVVAHLTAPNLPTEEPLKRRQTNLPETLVNRLREHRIVPFVGAGVSMSVRRRNSQDPLFPSWKELLRRAADRLKREQNEDYADLVDSLVTLGSKPGRSEKFFEAAREASNGLGSNWNDFLFEQFDHSIDEVADESLLLARLVWELGSRVVITTNYDKVLHWACPWHRDLAIWNIEAAANQVAMLRGESKRPVVWHLHGHVDDISDVVLTPDGYSRLYVGASQSESRYAAALETLRHQLASRSFLFVGFSLNDAQFSSQLRQVEQIYKGAVGPHYVLLSQAEADRLDRRDYQSIEVIAYEHNGLPLLAKLRELIAASGSMTGTSPRATSSLPNTSPASVSSELERPSKPPRKKNRQARNLGSSRPDLTNQAIKAEPDSEAESSSGQKEHIPDFEDDIEGVKRAIVARLDMLNGRTMLDDHGREVSVLIQAAEKVKLSTRSHDSDLGEQLADFLTKRHDYHDLGRILIVFQRLRQQKKHDEARRIGEIMDRLLPLCLPQNLAAEVWKQLTKDEEGLLRSGVGGTVGAELVVARLYRQHADFVEGIASEPRGKLLVALYDQFPIDDPDAGQAAVLRDLYVATHYAEIKDFDRQKLESRLTTEEIREKLSGYFEHIRDFKERPSYCVVKLPDQKQDFANLSNFLAQLRIPGLLFIGIASRRDKDIDTIESYVIQNLNTRYSVENES
jgi:SIR2-like domain/CHAT domain